MSKTYEQYQRYREWELFDTEIITNISFEHEYYRLPSDCVIKISRDSQFKLKATISGLINDASLLDANPSEDKYGIAAQENIFGYSPEGIFKYKINGIVVGNHNSQPASIDPPIARFEAELLLDSFEKYYYESEKENASLQDWFLSGKVEVAFSRLTRREVKKEFTRARLQIDEEKASTNTSSYGSSRDYLYINGPEFDFIIGKVPKEFGPDWSHNFCIEYRRSFRRLPSDDERRAIQELTSFVFGTQLLHIGSTNYGEEDQIVSLNVKNPWGDNVVSKCKNGSLPPTQITKHHSNEAEVILNNLLPQYLKFREELRLSGVIWKYWIARQSSIGTNLPILSSAIETLAEFVLKQHKDVKHYYIERNEFIDLINDELKLIEAKLSTHTHKDKMLNKLKGASQRGSNEKVEMMFEIIELEVGKVERDAMKARNKMAHSSFGKIDRDEAISLIKTTRAYETLFHRVFLKILGYQDNYIDYYSKGYPQRNIEEVIPN